MTRDQAPPQSPILVMPFGADPAARALAEACGKRAEFLDYDLKTLSTALRKNQLGVVVWSGPQSAMAQALRTGTPPSVAASAWAGPMKALLTVFRRHPSRLLLVDAQLVLAADPSDVAKLQLVLPLAGLPPMPDPQRHSDLPSIAAQLALPLMKDVQPIWEELLASSQSLGARAFEPGDLDAVVTDLFADAQPGDVNSETQLLREQLTELVEITAKSRAEAASHLEAERQNHATSVAELTAELDILRAELARMSAMMADSLGSSHDPQIASQTAQPAPAMGKDEGVEIALLREQIKYLQSEFEAAIIGAMTPKGPASSVDHRQVERAIAALLAELVAETEGRIRAEQDLHTFRRHHPQNAGDLARPTGTATGRN